MRPDAITLDVEDAPGVDVVGDAHHLPFADATFDYVWSSAVLEHVRDPFRVAAEIVRVLKPGGVAIVQVPFLENVHNWPDDYYRYTPNGLRVLFRELEEVKSGVSAGPSQVLPDLVQYFATGFSELQRGPLFPNLLASFVGTPLIPFRALDRLLRGRPTYWRWARAFYFIGRKPDEPSASGLAPPERRTRVTFVAPTRAAGFEEVMSVRGDEMVETMRRLGADVLAVPIDFVAADDEASPVARAARAYRADVIVAPNMNYFLKGLLPAESVLAKSEAVPVLMWDDPLGALALWLLERRDIPMGMLGPAGGDDPLELFGTTMRRHGARHFSWDSGHIASVVELGLIDRDAVSWYPIATYEPFLACGRERIEERFGVSFCGNVYPHAVDQSNFAEDSVYAALTDAICIAKSADLERPVWELMQTEIASLPADIRAERGLDLRQAPFWDYYVYLVWMAATTRVRLDALGAIARQVEVFGVFGDPSSVGELDRHANLVYRGNAHQSRELPEVFASTRVNVCPSNCLIHSGVPSKFVDCIASGGFALVDPKPDLVRLFGPEIERVFFRNAEELREKVEYFLERPAERREITEALRETVVRECTLERLFEQVLSLT